MQFETEFEPATPLEKSALRAIRTARWFANGWRSTPIKGDGLRYSQVAPMLERLDAGDLFQMSDETILELLEKTLVTYLNEMREGYGTYAVQKDTSHDDVFCPDLEKGRIMMERWKAFKSARQHVIDLRRARIIADSFS
jgi:hypothetical protein